MHVLPTLDPTLGFAAGVAVALVVLLALELYNDRRINRITAPMYEFAVQRAENDADRIVQDAQKEARRIIADAHTASAALSASGKREAEDAERAYQTTLKSMLANLEARVAESANAAQEAQVHLNEKIAAEFEHGSETARTQMAGSITALEADMRKRLETEMAQAVQAARDQAARYEQARKAAVDSNILSLVREALRITLQKDLSKDAHAELVRAALDEAKANSVF